MTTRDLTIKVHEIADDGLPDMENLTGQVAFIFDGCIVSGWPLDPTDPDITAYEDFGWDPDDGVLWEADDDVGQGRPMGGVTHWIEFPEPVWELVK